MQQSKMPEVVLGTLKIKVKEHPWKFMLVNVIQQAIHFQGEKEKSHQTLTDTRRKDCGDAKPQLSCCDASFGEGRSYNLALWKSWDCRRECTWFVRNGTGERGNSSIHSTVCTDSPHTSLLPQKSTKSLNHLGISHGTFSTGQVLPGHYFLYMIRTPAGTPKDSLVQCLKPKHLGNNLHRQQA